VSLPNGSIVDAEVVGFSGEKLYLMPANDVYGLVPGAKVVPVEVVHPLPRNGSAIHPRRRGSAPAREPLPRLLAHRPTVGGRLPVVGLGLVVVSLILCFFAVAANGDMFPCSEFIGLPSFKGGNVFHDDIEVALGTEAFRRVTSRKVEDIEPCRHCAIRHFCGAPCPAEAHEMNGSLRSTGAFCELYEEQVRYAFRLIAEGKEASFLWDGWDSDAVTTFDAGSVAGTRKGL